MVMELISEIDELLNGEEESTVGRKRLKKCKTKLQCLAESLRESKPGEIVSGAEILMVVSQAVHLMYKWVRD